MHSLFLVLTLLSKTSRSAEEGRHLSVRTQSCLLPLKRVAEQGQMGKYHVSQFQDTHFSFHILETWMHILLIIGGNLKMS